MKRKLDNDKLKRCLFNTQQHDEKKRLKKLEITAMAILASWLLEKNVYDTKQFEKCIY